jgi:hypothetical protein
MPIVSFKEIIQKDPLPMGKYVLDFWIKVCELQKSIRPKRKIVRLKIAINKPSLFYNSHTYRAHVINILIYKIGKINNKTIYS